MKVNDEMNVEPAPRRTQAERTAATRALLVESYGVKSYIRQP